MCICFICFAVLLCVSIYKLTWEKMMNQKLIEFNKNKLKKYKTIKTEDQEQIWLQWQHHHLV